MAGDSARDVTRRQREKAARLELSAEMRDRAREKLYVGMSRATDQLIVVGDRAVVREIGGPALAARLTIS